MQTTIDLPEPQHSSRHHISPLEVPLKWEHYRAMPNSPHNRTLEWADCPAVESIPGRVSGAWVFRDTRLPVATVIENLEDLSIDEVSEQFEIGREQIQAVLEFVAQGLHTPAPLATLAIDAHPL